MGAVTGGLWEGSCDRRFEGGSCDRGFVGGKL